MIRTFPVGTLSAARTGAIAFAPVIAAVGLVVLPILASVVPGVLQGRGPVPGPRPEFVSSHGHGAGPGSEIAPGFRSGLDPRFASTIARGLASTTARGLASTITRGLASTIVRGLSSMEARAQVPWESPRMLPPGGPGGLGFYYVRFESLPGADYGGLFTWDPPGFPDGLSLRAGAANGTRDRTAGFGGIDFSAPLVERSGDMSLDLAWSTGLGVAVGDYVLASLPVGITAGRAWSSGQVRIGPYVGAHAVMDFRAGGSAPEEEFQVDPSAEVGVDVSFDERRRVVLRAAAALGDRSALVLGFVLGGGS